MKIRGKIWKFRDDINTDEIIPAKFLNTTDHKELGGYCMSGIDETFTAKAVKGDIIVAGKNFGCGSSREHAPISIKGFGISCVIAESFARIFCRNSINIGLAIIECKNTNKFKQGDVLEIDTAKGEIKNITSNDVYQCAVFPEFLQDIMNKGGLMEQVKSEMKET